MAFDSVKEIFPRFLFNKGLAGPLILVLAILVYVNTLGHDFTQDDAIVIYQNDLVQKGVDGIAEIFSTDSFYGFFSDESKASLVSGGRYRPLSLAFFALVWEYSTDNTTVYHLINVFWFSVLCLLLYRTLLLFDRPERQSVKYSFALVTTLLFILHPIHTEVVANVKGLDEIFSLFWSLLSLNLAICYTKSKNSKNQVLLMVLMGLSFFLAMLSKENAVIFTIVIPVSIALFCSASTTKTLVSLMATLFISFALYMGIRYSIIGLHISEHPVEMMNNPFIKQVNGEYLPFNLQEKTASIIMGLGKYLGLLIFPHPLTHDYYPRYFEVMGMTHPKVLLATLMNLSLILIALLGVRKKSFLSFCIFFFYASIGLVSNIFFPIGTHISERFLFTPSLSICLVGGMAFVGLVRHVDIWKVRTLLLTLSLLLAFKTISRNVVWKDDFTLFTTDVEVSKNSAKVQNAAGGALLSKAVTLESNDKDVHIERAIEHLTKAIQIHPDYANAHLLLGNAYNYNNNYESSISSYQRALGLNPGFNDAFENLHLTLREAGRYEGSQNRDLVKAKEYLFRALDMKPNDYETNSLIGIAFGNEDNHLKAVEYFEIAVTIRPDMARAYANLAQAQLNLGDEDNAQINFQKAAQLDPGSVNFN